MLGVVTLLAAAPVSRSTISPNTSYFITCSTEPATACVTCVMAVPAALSTDVDAGVRIDTWRLSKSYEISV